jgi:DNA-binding MarR family transcriptional regulator
MDVVSECKVGSGEKNGTRFSACLLFSANALARAITAIGDEEFGRVGLSYSHAYLLSEVITQPGITPSELSDTLYLTPSTITRLVEKLEQKQLVRRESEGKKTLIQPTEAGITLQVDINEAWNRVGQRYAAAIGEANICQLTKQVFQAANALTNHE